MATVQIHEVQKLIQGLQIMSPEKYNESVRGLIELGSDAVEPLINTALSEKWSDSNFRIAAIGLLGRINDKRAVDPLIQLLHAHQNLRPATIQALVSLGDKRALQPLRDQVPGLENELRWEIRDKDSIWTFLSAGGFGLAVELKQKELDDLLAAIKTLEQLP